MCSTDEMQEACRPLVVEVGMCAAHDGVLKGALQNKKDWASKGGRLYAHICMHILSLAHQVSAKRVFEVSFLECVVCVGGGRVLVDALLQHGPTVGKC